MRVTASAPSIAVGDACSSSADEMFGGFFIYLNEAMQECQGVAVVGLRWAETTPGRWEATDPLTMAVYEIDARPF